MSLIIISNRLPITITEKNGKIVIKESMGGLVTGLKSHLSSLNQSEDNKPKYKWFGWPGKLVSKKLQPEFISEANKSNLYPLMIEDRLMDKFYHGFCNKTIWPLFHYFPSYTIYDEDLWKIYKQVNERFAEEIIKNIDINDTIWIHDYHLMLLPKLLRDKFPELTIGFFLHIPFPTLEIFRLFPGVWRKEILEGLLGSDLIGFHTFDYAKYFLRSIQRILGFDSNLGEIHLPDRIVKIDTFPMGIDYDGFINTLNSKEAQAERKILLNKFRDKKIILSIDRLDYSKGIINRLNGFQKFLEKYPEWTEKVILLLIVVPSRTGVEMYNQMKRQINEMVGYINGKFGNIHWTPIIYQYKSIDQKRLAGIYNVSDTALVTPLRDGMNLIAKEYLACKTDLNGILILSEMAGAFKELGEAIIINPNHAEEIAMALNESLTMPDEEKKRRNLIMRNRLKRYNVNVWANYFLSSLDKVKKRQESWQFKLVDEKIKNEIIDSYKISNRSLFLLDYDGTLVPFESLPEKASPPEFLLNTLTRLTADKRNEVIIISGRDRISLEKWFKGIKVTLVSEHGAWVKSNINGWEMQKDFNTEWKKEIYPFLEKYTDLLPGSFIEEKNFSLVWHFRKSDPDQASIKAKELLDDLTNITVNKDLQILPGSKIIEIKNTGINKGMIATKLLSDNKYDFIFTAGDDWTDEDLFKAVPTEAFSVKIGISSSNAKFNVRDYLELRNLLIDITNASKI